MSGDHPWVRPPAVAGSFYPSSPDQLQALVQECLAATARPWPDAPPPPGPPRAIVVPHAGLVYSGPIAATAYLRAAAHADAISRVVLLGPSHRVAFAGIAASSADAFATPLGLVTVDRAMVDEAVRHRAAFISDEAHAAEHSLEVQLPFLRTLLPEARLAPFVVGDATPDEVAHQLSLAWDEPGTLVVISTDLSHYHHYQEATELDRRTAAHIVALRPDRISGRDACGSRPLRGLLLEARRRHLRVEQLDLRSSGDTAGDRDRVVGYGAFAIA